MSRCECWFLLALSIALLVATTYYAGLTRGRREGRRAEREEAGVSTMALEATSADSSPGPYPVAAIRVIATPDDFELTAANGRIHELERQLETVNRLITRTWPPIDIRRYLSVRWARDDPDAMPVRVVSDHPMMREQSATQATDDAAPRSGTCRVVEVNHPHAIPIREAREGEPAFRIAFVQPEPGERAEWEDPRMTWRSNSPRTTRDDGGSR